MKIKQLIFIISFLLLLSSCGSGSGAPVGTQTETETPAVSGELTAKYPQLTNLPTLYITLAGGAAMSSVSQNEYVPGTYTLVTGNTSDSIYEKALSIKGRGNYSWSFEQKPYNIKLDAKNGMLGMGAAKKWVLITTYSDKTLLRNYMILNLAVNVGLRGAVEVRYVDVCFNGEYNGTYVLSGKIEIGNERIDVNYGILFEIEMQYRHSDCSNCIITDNGLHLVIKEYKGRGPEEVTDEEKNALKIQVNKAEEAMSDSNLYPDYIDTDSFVKWYIINEFTKNYDSNFTTSCYCYINEDGKLAMGPPWDYDTCMGNQDSTATGTSPEGFHVREGAWYSVLFRNPSFLDDVKEMWMSMRDEGVFDNLLASTDTLVTYISASESLDHARWPNALLISDLRGIQSLYTYREEVEYLKTWMNGRLIWLDAQYYNN